MYIYVLLTAFLFATMEVALKMVGSNLDPFQLTYVRFLIGGLILLPFALRELKQKGIRLVPKDFVVLLGIGVLGVTVSMMFFQLAVMKSNASTAAVIFCINPLFTMAFAALFSDERMDKYKAYVLGIALLGLVFLIRPWSLQEGNTAAGIILMILAALTFGAYTVLAKGSVRKMGAIAQTSFSFILGALVLLIVTIVLGRPVVAGLVDEAPLVIYVSVFVTGIGYWSYFKSIGLSDASTGSLAFFLKPAIAPFIAVIVLHEVLLWNTVVGILLILLASYMNLMFQRKTNAIRKRQSADDQRNIQRS